MLKSLLIFPLIAAVAGISLGEEAASTSKQSWLKAEIADVDKPEFVEGEPSVPVSEIEISVKETLKPTVVEKKPVLGKSVFVKPEVKAELVVENKPVAEKVMLPAGMSKGGKTTVTVMPVSAPVVVTEKITTTILAPVVPEPEQDITLNVAEPVLEIPSEDAVVIQADPVKPVAVVEVVAPVVSVAPVAPVEVVSEVPVLESTATVKTTKATTTEVIPEISESLGLDALPLGALEAPVLVLEGSEPVEPVEPVVTTTKVTKTTVKKELSLVERLRRVSEGRVALEELGGGVVDVGETYPKSVVTKETQVVVVAADEEDTEPVEVYDLVDQNSSPPIHFKTKDYSDKSRGSTQLRYYRATRPVYDGDVY